MPKIQSLIMVAIISLFVAIFTAAGAAFFALSTVNEYLVSGSTTMFVLSLIIGIALLLPFGIYNLISARKNKKWGYAYGVLNAIIIKHSDVKINKEAIIADLRKVVKVTGREPIEVLNELLTKRYNVTANPATETKIAEATKLLNASIAKLPTLEGAAKEKEQLNHDRRKKELESMEMQFVEVEKATNKVSNNFFISFLAPYLISIVLGAIIVFAINQGIITLPTFDLFDSLELIPEHHTLEFTYSFHFGVILVSGVCNFIISYKSLSKVFA